MFISCSSNFSYFHALVLHFERVSCHSLGFRERLSFIKEPISILSSDVKQLHSRHIPVVKVQCRHRPLDEATWEFESNMHSSYPQLFVDLGTSLSFSSRIN